jgi:hypothetical protein
MATISEHDFPPLPSQASRRRPRKSKASVNTDAHPTKLATSIATIDDLPDELILEILDYLPGVNMDHFQLPTLTSLSLTNRRFHRMVAEKLFKTYNSHFCDPYAFLRTLVSNTLLASCVYNVNMTYGPMAHSSRKQRMATAQDKRIIKEGMRHLGIPGWKEWAAACNELNTDIEFLHSAILMHTPNIKSLTVQETYAICPRSPKWLELLRRASTATNPGRVHQFTHLRSIRVGVSQLKLSELAPLFRLQSLRRLFFRDLIDYDCGHGHRIPALQRLIPAACNNIEDFQLEQSFLNMDMLGILLASARKLKVFSYEVAADNIPQGLDPQHLMGTMRFSHVLIHQEASLERLHLSCDYIAERELCRTLHLLGGLQRLKALEHLDCPFSTILETPSGTLFAFVQEMPPSLQSFRTSIGHVSEPKDCLSAFAQIAANQRTSLHPLREIRINMASPEGWQDYDWEPIVKLFSTTDVKFIVEREEKSEWGEVGEWITARVRPSESESEESEEVDLYSDRS